MSLTQDEIDAINQRENGRVGLEVKDHHGRSYWITDVLADDRLRVVGEDGRGYYWNPSARVAVLIKKPRTLEQERSA